MPLKIGKSKSSSGSELVHTNSCPEECSHQTRKNRGLRQFFNRSKCNSKIPTGRSSATEDSTNSVKSSRVLGKALDNIIAHRTESSPVNLQALTCHSVSPKLYANSCASSIEELSKAVINTNVNSTILSCAVPCSPITDVIVEEDYEDALLLNNRMAPYYSSEVEVVSKENIALLGNGTKKINQGIYNEPNDTVLGSEKEIIEPCRICQITPTNQFKEIRSRSGSDTDALLVHSDLVVGGGGRCSTNSSSVGSALTLSDSPAIICPSYSPLANAPTGDTRSSSSVPCGDPRSSSMTALAIHTSPQSTSSPPTVYSHSPKGNTVICHHPASPFTAPSSTSRPSHSPDLTTVADSLQTASPTISGVQDLPRSPFAGPGTTSRRPGRFNRPSAAESSISTGKCHPDGSTPSSVSGQPRGQSDRRSEYYTTHPVYEEAWDLRLKRLCLDMERSSASMARPENATLLVGSSALESNQTATNRPQSAAGTRRRTDSPGSRYCSPPAVPPHRRSSVHVKMPHCNSFEDAQSLVNAPNDTARGSGVPTDDCKGSQSEKGETDPPHLLSSQRSQPKHCINPAFEDQGLTTDYDYAYNETWSLGIQDSVPLASTGYMDKIDSADSEETDSFQSTSQEATASTVILGKESIGCETINSLDDENGNVDNDSLSNDSYEEPWDVRHVRVISELTSARLIDPACVLPGHDSSQNERGTENNPTNHQKSQRSQDQIMQISSLGQRNMLGVGSMLINKSIVLDDQPWYHVDCSRSHAEQLLTGAVEGSFLVRRSETCKNDFSLTIRHRDDFLHMKISRNTRGFILGQYSQPYSSIPHMLHHYSLTMVPVRGADAVILKNPIIR